VSEVEGRSAARRESGMKSRRPQKRRSALRTTPMHSCAPSQRGNQFLFLRASADRPFCFESASVGSQLKGRTQAGFDGPQLPGLKCTDSHQNEIGSERGEPGRDDRRLQ